MEDVHWECGESAGYVGLESPKISISTSCPEGKMIVLLFDRVPDRLRVYTWRISFSFKFHRKLPENQPAPRTSLDLKLPERLSGKVLARGRPSVHRKTFHCDAPSRHVLRVNSISLMGREEGQNPFVLSPTCVCAEVDCVTTIAAQGQWPVGKRRTGQRWTLASYHSEGQETAWHSKRGTSTCFVRADRHCFCSHHPG